MYLITLTYDERRAIDWVGNRYWHGNELSNLLILRCEYDPDLSWSDDGDITFRIPEHVAWEMQDLIEADSLTCFDAELVSKLNDFCRRIV